MLGMHRDRFRDDRVVAEAERREDEEGRDRRGDQQHHGLDDLHPGRRHHAAEHHVADHQRADAHDGVCVRQPEQELDQLSGPDDLRDQVERDDRQGREGRERADRTRRQAERQDVRVGVLAQAPQLVGQEEHDQRVAHRVADGVDEAVEPGREDESGQAQERARRDKVARQGEAVLEARDRSARRVIVGRRPRPPGGPVRDRQGDGRERREQGDRGAVEGASSLRGAVGERRVGRERSQGGGPGGGETHRPHAPSAALASRT